MTISSWIDTPRPPAATFGLAMLAALWLGGCGLTAPRASDGYADLDSLGMLDVDNTLTLSIGPALIRLAARHMEDEPELRALLLGLEGVRIRIYEIDGNPARVLARMDRMQSRLRGQGWRPVAVVHEEDESVHVLMKVSGDRVCGLTVLSSDLQEAVVVNVMGDLSPEYFSDAMGALDLEAPSVRVATEES